MASMHPVPQSEIRGRVCNVSPCHESANDFEWPLFSIMWWMDICSYITFTHTYVYIHYAHVLMYNILLLHNSSLARHLVVEVVMEQFVEHTVLPT